MATPETLANPKVVEALQEWVKAAEEYAKKFPDLKDRRLATLDKYAVSHAGPKFYVFGALEQHIASRLKSWQSADDRAASAFCKTRGFNTYQSFGSDGVGHYVVCE